MSSPSPPSSALGPGATTANNAPSLFPCLAGPDARGGFVWARGPYGKTTWLARRIAINPLYHLHKGSKPHQLLNAMLLTMLLNMGIHSWK